MRAMRCRCGGTRDSVITAGSVLAHAAATCGTHASAEVPYHERSTNTHRAHTKSHTSAHGSLQKHHHHFNSTRTLVHKSTQARVAELQSKVAQTEAELDERDSELAEARSKEEK